MRATTSVCAALLLLLAGQGLVRADGPLVRKAGDDAGVSNLKFTGDVQTDEIRWGRGGYGYGGGGYGYGRGYYGYGYRGGYYGSYGYGYGYPYYAYSSPYYNSAPYYTYSSPYYYGGYNYGYPYRRGFYRIDMTTPVPAATPLGSVPVVAGAPKSSGPSAPGSLQLTEYVPYSSSGGSVAVVRGGNGSVPVNRSYPYDGGPKSIVPVPSGGSQPNFIVPAPSGEPNRPMVPRDGLPVSLPSEMTGEVSPVVYLGSAVPVSTTVLSSSSTPRIAYPAFGDPR